MVSVTPEALKSKYDEVTELDEKIAAATGSVTSGKRAIANQLVSEYTAVWQEPVTVIVNKFTELSVEELIATVTALRQALKKGDDSLETKMDDYLEAKVAETQKDQPIVSAEELEVFLATRKDRYQEYKALRDILTMFGEDVSSIPVPKSMRGARGPRGPRALSKFDYFVDGEARAPTMNTIASIAQTEGFESAKALRDFLAQHEVDPKKPPEEWEVELPNGKTLSAVKKEEFVGEEDNGEEEAEEEELEEELEEEETE